MLASKLLTSTLGATASATTWTPIFLRNLLNEVAYSSGLNTYVAVGQFGAIYTSSDATTWTRRTSGITTTLESVTWTGTYFIAVGGTSVFLRSPDGINWSTTSGTMSPQSAQSVASNGATVVVVGGNGNIRLSTDDGATWTSPSSGTSATLNAVQYANGRFVAVGNPGVVYSASGSTWTVGTASGVPSFTSLTYSTVTGQWIAGTQFGDIQVSTNNGATFVSGSYSTNLVATSVTSLTYGNGLFVATQGTVNTGYIYTTPDPTTTAWTQRLGYPTQPLWGVFWDGSKFVSVGKASSVYTSANGTAWTIQNTGTTQTLRGVTCSTGASASSLFVAVGDYGTIITSTDLVTWTNRTSGTTENLNAVTYSSSLGIFVAVGNAGNVVHSYDGVTWTLQTGITYSDNIVDITFNPKNLTFYGIATGTPWLISSADGVNWGASASVLPSTIVSIASSTGNLANGILVVATSTSSVYMSTDGGSSWSPNSSVSGTKYKVRDNGQYFTMVGSNGNSWFGDSTNAWTLISTSTTQPLYAVSSSFSRYPATNLVCVSGGTSTTGTVVATQLRSDGSFWSVNTISPDYVSVPRDSIYSNSASRYVAVGDDGQIAVSRPVFGYTATL